MREAGGTRRTRRITSETPEVAHDGLTDAIQEDHPFRTEGDDMYDVISD